MTDPARISSPAPAAAPVAVGDYVRSYDFPGQDSCYVEGTVESITPPMQGCPRYKILVERRVFDGQELPVPEPERVVYPPVNGTPSLLGGETCGVAKCERPAPPSAPAAPRPR